MPIESLANAFHLLGSVKHNLTVWGRVRVAYPQKTRNKPAERRALRVSRPPAHHLSEICTALVRIERSGALAALAYLSRAFVTRAPKQGHNAMQRSLWCE